MATEQRFGGAWTARKLECLEAYLTAYNTALKNQPFRRIFIDAFAGTGYRTNAIREDAGDLFEVPAADLLAEGSARKALKIEPPFHEYVFIEKNRRNFGKLRSLIDEFPEKRSQISFINKDANIAILDLCRNLDWRATRAVLFLDPYGMQVDWKTIKAVAATKSIDMWYLFPSGIAIKRLLPQDAQVPKEWQGALDRCLGDEGWRDVLIEERTEIDGDLFGSMEKHVIKAASIKNIESYFLDLLRSIFPGVAPVGLQLPNSRGYCMYLLCFACGNPNRKAPNRKAIELSVKLAKAVLKTEK